MTGREREQEGKREGRGRREGEYLTSAEALPPPPRSLLLDLEPRL